MASAITQAIVVATVHRIVGQDWTGKVHHRTVYFPGHGEVGLAARFSRSGAPQLFAGPGFPPAAEGGGYGWVEIVVRDGEIVATMVPKAPDGSPVLPFDWLDDDEKEAPEMAASWVAGYVELALWALASTD